MVLSSLLLRWLSKESVCIEDASIGTNQKVFFQLNILQI